MAAIELSKAVAQPGDPWIYILSGTFSAALAVFGTELVVESTLASLAMEAHRHSYSKELAP